MDKLLLDGIWQFCFDNNYGTVNFPNEYDKEIRVPFQVESKLSLINYTGDIKQCWYKKEVEGFTLEEDQNLVLSIGACDYKTLVFVNKVFVGSHIGGYTPIELCIDQAWSQNSVNVIEICVQDDMTDRKASGKQTLIDKPHGCFYTRTTGIWQSVYLTKRQKERITSVKCYPDISKPAVKVALASNAPGKVEITAYYEGRACGSVSGELYYKGEFEIVLTEKHLWELGCGRIYDLVVTFGKDIQNHKFGLREVKYEGYKFLLNGKSVFQRLVLDQGYYEDGIYTPESVEEFEKDIKRCIELGFNGARLHQKLFAPEYLDIADKYGFMVWGEYAIWGINHADLNYLGTFISEWKEALDRDFNHPCIVTWCPLNEVWSNTTPARFQPDLRFVDAVYEFTKAYDTTRPCVDVSGGYHGKNTDLFDFHCYQSPEILKAIITRIEEKNEVEVDALYGDEEHTYKPFDPVNVSEYGGIALVKQGPDDDRFSAWGYGSGERNSADLVRRINELNDIILASERISGLCYTQLYDVMQEQNGLLTYDRQHKLTSEDIKSHFEHLTQKAKIED